jgi:hypothetical protein
MLGVVKLVALTRSEPSPRSTYLLVMLYQFVHPRKPFERLSCPSRDSSNVCRDQSMQGSNQAGNRSPVRPSFRLAAESRRPEVNTPTA